MSTKVYEARLRRLADRQGLILRKSRRRDPDAIDYGLYALFDVQAGGTIHPQGVVSPYSLDLDEARELLGGLVWDASRPA